MTNTRNTHPRAIVEVPEEEEVGRQEEQPEEELLQTHTAAGRQHGIGAAAGRDRRKRTMTMVSIQVI